MSKTILFADGFDWCTTAANLAQRGWISTNPSLGVGSGRFGTNCASSSYVGYNFNADLRHIVPGSPITNVAVHVAINNIASSGASIFYLNSGTNSQILLKVNSIGRLELYVGGVLKSTSNAALNTSTWYSLQLHATIAAAGRVIVARDASSVTGPPILDWSGDTRGYPTIPTVDSVGFPASGNNIWVDDVVLSTFTDIVNDFTPGDYRLKTLFPSGGGDTTTLAVTGAASNYLAEQTNDGDTSYVSSINPGDTDLYTYPASMLTGNIYAVIHGQVSRKSDTGSRSAVSAIKTHGTVYANNAGACQTTYAVQEFMRTVNPSTGLPWTVAEVDALQAGPQVGA